MAFSEYLWFFAVAVGPVILGGAALYALLRRRRLRTGERVARDAATEKLYRKGP